MSAATPAPAVAFFVPGTPRPQGSKRAFANRKTGQPIIVESGGRNLTDWRGDVKRAAMEAMGEDPPATGPVSCGLTFYLIRPKSHPKTKKTYPVTRPDADKLARGVLDAITSVCFVDDAQIVYLETMKRWAPDGQSGVRVIVQSWPGGKS